MTVLAVSAVMAVSVMTATPLKLNPPPLFLHPDESGKKQNAPRSRGQLIQSLMGEGVQAHSKCEGA